MHREGHIGIGMAIYAPIAYVLFEAGLRTLFALGLVAIAAWSFLPDIDMALPIRHRGPTHSIVAAALAGVLTALVFVYLLREGHYSLRPIGITVWYLAYAMGAGFGFGVAFLGVIGHIVGDVLTPMGVQPWWPLSRRKHTLKMVLAADEDANRTLGFLGAVAVAAALVLSELR